MTGANPATSARQHAEKTGRRAETFASFYLALSGFHILERRYKTRSGEIDLIAKRKDTIIFVEVKARPTVDLAVEAVTPRARRRIEHAGHTFLLRNPKFADYGVRYDIVAVTGWRVRRIPDAWREGD